MSAMSAASYGLVGRNECEMRAENSIFLFSHVFPMILIKKDYIFSTKTVGFQFLLLSIVRFMLYEVARSEDWPYS